jgi:hypothetical protein
METVFHEKPKIAQLFEKVCVLYAALNCISTMHTTACRYFRTWATFRNVPTIFSMVLTIMVWCDVITIDPWAFTQSQQSFYMWKQQFTAKTILCATVKLCYIAEYKLHLNRTFFQLWYSFKNSSCVFSICIQPTAFSICIQPTAFSICIQPTDFIICIEPTTFSICIQPTAFSVCIQSTGSYSLNTNYTSCTGIRAFIMIIIFT